MAQKPGPFKTKVKEIILLSHRFLTCQFSNGYNETGVGIMDNFQLMDMQLSSARGSFQDVDLRTSNHGPTRQTGPVHHPSGGVVHLSTRHHAGECDVGGGGPIMPGS